MAPPLCGADPPQLVRAYAAMSLRGHVVLSFKVHKDGTITDLQIMQPSAIDAFTKSAFNAIKSSNPTVPLPLEFPDENAPFIVTFYFNETPPGGGADVTHQPHADTDAAGWIVSGADGARDLRGGARLRRVKPRLVAIVGPTATGKSALGIALAKRFEGEIISCDSTAVYRGFDIGTDKVPLAQQQGIPHHMVDVADPTEEYSAARYAREAATAIRDISARGRLPIVVGGTGFYYRALTRGLFDGPSRDERLRRRLERVAERRGPGRLHRWLATSIRASAERIKPADIKRVVRALEVWILTGRPLTEHFAETASPLPEYEVTAFALQIPAEEPPSVWRAGSTRSSSRVCSTRCARCSRAESPSPPCRSPAWSIARPSSICTACVMKPRRAS